MKICHIAPPETNSATSRGGPTRVFFDLNEGLAKIADNLYVYAQRDAKVSGHLVYHYDTNLNNTPFYLAEKVKTTQECYGLIHYAKAYEYAKNFDIIQAHIDRPLFFTKFYPKPKLVITIEGPLTYYRKQMVKNFNTSNVHFVLPSKSVADGWPEICQNYSIIHHAIDLNDMTLQKEKAGYFLYVGRLVAYKGVHLAIKACLELKQKLIIIGKPDKNDQASIQYFAEKVRPHLNNPLIKHIPEVPHSQMAPYYQAARAFVFPLPESSQEAFGLVLAEALACGTPIVCFDNPLTRELFGNAPIAYLAKNPEDFKKGLNQVEQISPEDCRQYSEKHFSRERMAKDYYHLYQKLLQEK